MRRVFVDTHYWVAIISPTDQWREKSLTASFAMGDARLLTTDEILTETLNYFSKARTELRQKAVSEVRTILMNQNVEVVSCSHIAFLNAVEFYENRPDKGYSLTDCISMNICRERGISDILTHDDHFRQEGFTILL